jgi:hypothetical protein
VLAWAISCMLLSVAIAIIGDAARTEELAEWIARLSALLAFAALWPITYTLWPAKPEEGAVGGVR